ncbi:MAG: hypothetical protein HYR55_01635 [Acidobacteria bacterium]|nr:hypothetical protein [Acidobacteriota bacterium]MBI3656343.1 hypothetical protein [Acidobacteriota bacterium]
MRTRHFISKKSWVVFSFFAALLTSYGLCEQTNNTICDNVLVCTSPEGVATVVNNNEQAIRFDLVTTRTVCSSSQCTWTSTYPDVTLDAGESAEFEFIPDTRTVRCLMIYCCDSPTGRGATLTRLAELSEPCEVTDRVSWDDCAVLQ